MECEKTDSSITSEEQIPLLVSCESAVVSGEPVCSRRRFADLSARFSIDKDGSIDVCLSRFCVLVAGSWTVPIGAFYNVPLGRSCRVLPFGVDVDINGGSELKCNFNYFPGAVTTHHCKGWQISDTLSVCGFNYRPHLRRVPDFGTCAEDKKIVTIIVNGVRTDAACDITATLRVRLL